MGPPQRGAVLAALAVDAARPVFRDTLIDRIWSGRAPEGAASALYAHINRIRRMLAAGAAGAEPVRLARRSGGYVLEVDPQEVDLHRFRRLALAARDRQRPDDERAKLLREALDLWRGEPLTDLPGEWPARMRDSWEEERLDAAVAWAQAELRMGRPDEGIGPVPELVAGPPLSEPPIPALIQPLAAPRRHAPPLDCDALARARGGGGPPGSRRVSRRAAICRPARLRPGPANSGREGFGAVPDRPRRGRAGYPARPRRSRRPIPDRDQRAADAGGAGQRRLSRADPPAAAWHTILLGRGDEPG